jgi:ribosomal protein S18 acetylase RimI-like enzyme
MRIETITLANHHLVTGLFNSYRVFYKQQPDLHLAENFIKARLQNDESVIFVALVDVNGTEVPAGFTQLYPSISSVRALRNWLLNDLYVAAEFRKQGIGEALIKTAIDFARNDGAKLVKLETAADNHIAQSLYEAIGFKKQEPDMSFFTYHIQL